MPQEIVNGYVLRKVPYSETSVIISLFTRERGKVDFVVHGERKLTKKHLPKIDLLRLLSISFNYKEKRELQSAGNIEVIKDYSQIAHQYRVFERIQWLIHFLSQNLEQNSIHPLLYDAFSNCLEKCCQSGISKFDANSYIVGTLLNSLLEEGQIDPDIIYQGNPSLSVFMESLENEKKTPQLDESNWEAVLLWLERTLQHARYSLPKIHLTNFSKK